jgi:hypothetical protein
MNKDNTNLDLENLAPISVSVYTRLKHFKNCIKSLTENDLAKHTVLYIFSDFPKPGDEEAVLKVRRYAKSIDGFKSVKLVFQKKNDFNKNERDAREVPYNNHNKLIRLEDDIIVQKSFLKFMNMALNIYEKYDNIFCICGYVGPENHKYDNEAQAYQIQNSTGVGYWKKKYYKYLEDYNFCHPWLRVKKNFFYFLKFSLYFGFNNILPLKQMYKKNLYHGDQLIGEYIFRKDMLIIIPPFSLALNKGNDGSGVHSEDSKVSQNEQFLRESNNFIFPNKFNKQEVIKKTQLTLKFREYKPSLVRQLYFLIVEKYSSIGIIIKLFKK